MFGAFRVRGERLADARIALIDDVLTTGATLEAAAGVLLEAGALEVRAVTLAATLPETRLAPRNSGRTVTGGPGPRPLSSGALADRGRPGGFRERQDPTEPIHSGAAHARSPADARV